MTGKYILSTCISAYCIKYLTNVTKGTVLINVTKGTVLIDTLLTQCDNQNRPFCHILYSGINDPAFYAGCFVECLNMRIVAVITEILYRG